MQEHKASPSSSPSGLFLPTPPSLFYSTEGATARDTFLDDNHTDSPSCVAPTARATRQSNQSANTLSNVNLESVTVQHSGLTLGDGADEGKEDSVNECCDKSATQPTTLTEHSVTTEVTDKSVIDVSVNKTASDNSRQEIPGMTRDIYKQIMDCLQDRSETMDRIISSSRLGKEEDSHDNRAGEDGNHLDTS
eukprot:TRINITY_DN747_c0_g1_i11.p1 TRINITY_DN747_c0_g1~~TRINITY_DN747_c0_g1_i11.p1  ORF type:complete len:192 (+),score=36.54 TRINITY_DN747_c0_g1_i11:444-1019(+)